MLQNLIRFKKWGKEEKKNASRTMRKCACSVGLAHMSSLISAGSNLVPDQHADRF